MKATYIGSPGDPQTQAVEQHGVVFKRGEAVDIDHLNDQQKAKLQNNPTFAVKGAGNDKDAAAKTKAANVKPAPVDPSKIDIPPSFESLDDAALHELATKLDPTLDEDATREVSLETVKAELDRRAAALKTAPAQKAPA